MKKIADFIVKFRYAFLGLFIALIVLSVFLIPKVNTNYNFIKYLDKNSDTVVALNKMEEEFSTNGNAKVMVENIDSKTALDIKTKLEKVDNVKSVVFDITDNENYNNNNALYTIFLTYSNFEPQTHTAISEIRSILSDYNISLSGESINSFYLQNAIGEDMVIILLIACAVIFVILLLSSTSWIDPLIFAIVVGGAIIINLGTNVLLGEVSFITKSICAIMQIALAMDYSIIVLHRYNEEKATGLNNKEALSKTLAQCFSPVSASSLTTIAGLAALMFMRFTIGFDVGMVLAKGIIVSLISVFLFMPSLILLFAPLIEKTKHRSFSFKHTAKIKESIEKIKNKSNFSSFQFKTRNIVPFILVILIAAGVVLQQNIEYSYNLETAKNSNAAINVEKQNIEDNFGIQNSLVVMIPKKDLKKQQEIIDYLINYKYNNEKVITGGKGIVSTGLYDSMSAVEAAAKFGISESVVSQVFNSMNIELTKKVKTVDLLKFLSENNYVIESGKSINATITQTNNSITEMFAPLTLSQAQAVFKLTEQQATALFYSINGELPTSASTALNHQIVTALYESSANEDLKNTYMSIQQAFAKLNAQQIKAAYPFINDSTLAEIYTALNKNIESDLIENYKLVQIIYAQDMVNKYAQAMQAIINETYGTAEFAVSLFDSKNFTRIFFNLCLETGSKDAFNVIEEIRKGIDSISEDNYIICESASYYDIKQVFEDDTTKINLISFFAIFFIILITFRSASIPVLLTLLIQGSIWITMSLNTFFTSEIFFICYLLVMCIQMGATVDYAILMTNRYIEARKTLSSEESIRFAFKKSISTILTSGSILVIAAFIVGLVSEVSIISTFGLLLSMGCLISLLLIVFALPQTLLLCDKILEKTSLGKKFHKK